MDVREINEKRYEIAAGQVSLVMLVGLFSNFVNQLDFDRFSGRCNFFTFINSIELPPGITLDSTRDFLSAVLSQTE